MDFFHGRVILTIKSILIASHQAAEGSILGVSNNFSLDVAEIYWPAQNNEQRLATISQTHLVLASGKLVLKEPI